jgi:tetratricopeptide (TPR) repeat protein
LSHFDAALVIARAADLQWHLGPTLIGRAHVRVALGELGLAWVDLNEALPRLETLRLVRYQIMAHDALGCLFLDVSQPEPALQHFERGLCLARDAGIMYWRPRLQANLVMAQLRLGRPCDRAALLAAQQYAQDYSEAWLSLRCLEALAELALASGDAHGCIVHADALLALASHGDLRELAGQAHRLRGLARLAILAHEPAREALLLALELAEQIGSVRLAWACHRALAQVAAALGDGGGQNASEARARSLAEQMGGSLAGSGLVMAQQRPQPGHTPLQ